MGRFLLMSVVTSLTVDAEGIRRDDGPYEKRTSNASIYLQAASPRVTPESTSVVNIYRANRTRISRKSQNVHEFATAQLPRDTLADTRTNPGQRTRVQSERNVIECSCNEQTTHERRKAKMFYVTATLITQAALTGIVIWFATHVVPSLLM